MGVVDTGNGTRIECDSCERELEPEDPVAVWHHKRGGDLGAGYVKTRGCLECVDAALTEEIRNVRGFSLRRTFRLMGGEYGVYAREAECNHCGRGIVFATETNYKEPYTRTAYCSEHCRDEHTTHPRKPKICKACSVRFVPTRSDAKTCSPACKQKLYRQRKHAIH